MEMRTWENIGLVFTADGHPITPGMRVINYDYREDVVIEPLAFGHDDEPVWFKTRLGVFDGSRLRKA